MPLAQGKPVWRFGWVLFLVLFDLWSKDWVFRHLGATAEGYSQPQPLAGEWLRFASTCNGGAAFGQFDQFPWVLVIGRALAVVFLAWLVLRAEPRPRLVLVAMVLVLAGALGNLIDNLWLGCTIPGRTFPLGVRDFLALWFKPLLGIDYHFPAFNVADACITVGACAWILAGFLHKPSTASAPGAS
ncbi:MAG: signal peptidase II [Planctomycetota bacterium]